MILSLIFLAGRVEGRFCVGEESKIAFSVDKPVAINTLQLLLPQSKWWSTTLCIVDELFTLHVLFLLGMFDHQLFISRLSFLLRTGTGENCYRNGNRFSDRVWNENEIEVSGNGGGNGNCMMGMGGNRSTNCILLTLNLYFWGFTGNTGKTGAPGATGLPSGKSDADDDDCEGPVGKYCTVTIYHNKY